MSHFSYYVCKQYPLTALDVFRIPIKWLEWYLIGLRKIVALNWGLKLGLKLESKSLKLDSMTRAQTRLDPKLEISQGTVAWTRKSPTRPIPNK